MPFAQVHYPFENARLVRAPLPGRLHRRVHRADPRLVLHHARAGHRAVRPAGVPQLREPRHPARRRRPQDVQEPAQLPGRLRDVRRVRLGRDALDADVLAGAARRRHAGHRGGASATRSGRCCCRCGTSGTSSRSTPTPTAYDARPRGPTRRTCSTGTCWPRPASWSPTVDARRWTPTTSRGACAAVRSYLDALTNWYVRRSRDRFWAGDADAFDTLYTVLETLCRVVAPLAPLTAEEIWRGLTGERSVHLTDWPSAGDVPGRPRPGRRDGRGPRGLLGGAVAAQGQGPAGAAAAGRR